MLEGDYGELFGKRSANLSDIETKYGKFLKPSELKPLINLERLLRSLSGNIKVRLKLRVQTGAFLIPSIENKIFHRVHEIMKVLKQFKNLGLLKPD